MFISKHRLKSIENSIDELTMKVNLWPINKHTTENILERLSDLEETVNNDHDVSISTLKGDFDESKDQFLELASAQNITATSVENLEKQSLELTKLSHNIEKKLVKEINEINKRLEILEAIKAGIYTEIAYMKGKMHDSNEEQATREESTYPGNVYPQENDVYMVNNNQRELRVVKRSLKTGLYELFYLATMSWGTSKRYKSFIKIKTSDYFDEKNYQCIDEQRLDELHSYIGSHNYTKVGKFISTNDLLIF